MMALLPLVVALDTSAAGDGSGGGDARIHVAIDWSMVLARSSTAVSARRDLYSTHRHTMQAHCTTQLSHGWLLLSARAALYACRRRWKSM